MLSDDELVKLALARFGPMREGRRPETFETLSPDFQDLDSGTLARAVIRAFERGLVDIRPTEVAFSYPPTDVELEARLRSVFRLQRTIVIQWGPREKTDGGKVENDLAYALGATLARYLSNIFRDHDRVGLGGGRTCYSLSTEFQSRFANQTARDVTFYSMAGKFNVRNPASQRAVNVVMDPDLNALRMAEAWQQERVGLKLLSAPALSPEITDLEENKKRSWLCREKGEKGDKDRGKPAFVIVGAGNLRDSIFLGSMKELGKGSELGHHLGELEAICKKSWTGAGAAIPYCPVADCANRLFVVPPPEGSTMSDETLEKVRALVKSVNDHLLAVDIETLLSTRLWIVSGGVEKARALYTLMTEPGRAFGLDDERGNPVELLCVDSVTANALLELERTSGPPPAASTGRTPASRRAKKPQRAR